MDGGLGVGVNHLVQIQLEPRLDIGDKRWTERRTYRLVCGQVRSGGRVYLDRIAHEYGGHVQNLALPSPTLEVIGYFQVDYEEAGTQGAVGPRRNRGLLEREWSLFR